MNDITNVEALEALYGTPSEASIIKVSPKITSLYRKLIEASPFVGLATSGPDGLDCSPRGDAGQVVFIEDDHTLILPDRRGNNRMDSLRNIIHNPEVALMFLIPGSNTTLRLNGTATISADPKLLAKHEVAGKLPRSVIIITIRELYFQCARALMRAEIWNAEKFVNPEDLPTPGALMQEIKAEFDAKAYDKEWPERAQKTMW